MSVALVLVAHTAKLAAGCAELAAQMAPDVTIELAGGADGEIGTSFDLIEAAVGRAAAAADEVGIITDIGSAVLTTDAVLEFLDDDLASRVRWLDCPFVEGAVAAAVAAQQGANLAQVWARAHAAWQSGALAELAAKLDEAPVESQPDASDAEGRVVLRNKLGLHARPAALVAQTAVRLDAEATINGVNAASVLELMKLGVVGGQELTVRASGPNAAAAVTELVKLLGSGFGEDQPI
jgi:PTS hybrid protein